MDVSKTWRDHKFLVLLIGTVVIQLFFLGVAQFGVASSSVDSEEPRFSLDHAYNKLDDGVVTSAELPEELVSEEITRFPDMTTGPVVENEKDLLSKQGRIISPIPDDPEPPEEPTLEKTTIRNYVVKPGDTLTRIWTELDNSYAGGLAAARALKAAGISLNVLRAGDKVEFELDPEGKIIKFSKRLSGGRTLVLNGDPENGYAASVIEPEVIESKRTAYGSIESSIVNAAGHMGVQYEVVDQLVDLFGSRVEFSRDLHPGDSFSVVYTERRLADGELLEPGPILAASLKNQGKMLAAIRYDRGDGSDVKYYDERGESIGNFFLRYPVKFSRISSKFNRARFHPVLKVRRPHNGVDFAAPTGTPVRSVGDGVVVKAGRFGGAGNMVKIKHGPRWQTAYLHLHRISKGIRKGLRIKRGQVIGSVGSTGLATGAHLHFSLYDRGRYVDPMKVDLPKMPTTVKPIPAGILKVKLETLERFHDAIRIANAPAESLVG